MTREEIESIKKRIVSGWDMVMQLSEKIGKEKNEWSLCDLYKASDIVKDQSETFKNLIKVERMIAESGLEKY